MLYFSVLTAKHLVALNIPLLFQVMALTFDSFSQIKC